MGKKRKSKASQPKIRNPKSEIRNLENPKSAVRNRENPQSPTSKLEKQRDKKAARTRWYPWLVLGLSLAAYADTLGHALVWDDFLAITKNPLVASLDIGRIFSTAYWYPDPKLTDLYRPITVLSFGLNYRIAGYEPFAYHLTNVLLHALNSMLLYWLIGKLTRTASLALAAALIFALHPIHTEPVAWVSGRAELLACFFMLAAWNVSLIERKWLPPILRVTSAALLYLLALLSKESALVFLPVIWSFRAVAFQVRRHGESSGALWRSIFRPVDLAFAAAALCMLGLRAAMLGQVGPKTADTVPFVENPLAYSPLITRLLTSVKLLGLYFWKMVLPLHLSSDYSFNQIPMSTLADPGFWLALGTVVALVLLALRMQLSSWLVGGALATAVALGMALNLFFPTGTLFAERLAYFPLVGFSVALASLIEHPWIARRLFVSGHVLLAAVLLAFLVRTVFRNLDWKDEVTVFTTMARTAPESAKALTLSGILQAGQQPLLARSRFERALQIYPEYSQAKLGLAQAEINSRNYSKAEELLTDVLKTDPNSTEALQALAVAYRGSGKFAQSLQISDRILARRPDDALALGERAMALEGLKRNAEAKAAYQKAISAGADSAEIRNRFGSLYLQERNFPAALEQFLQAGRLQPSDPVTYYNLADVYRQTDDKVRERQAYIDFLRNWRGNPKVAATIRSRLQALR